VLEGLRRLFFAVIVASAVLWSPAAAFACGGGPSAGNVYSECVPTGSGSKSASSGAHNSGSGTGSAQSPVSAQTAKALQHTSKQNRRRLAHLLGAYGTTRLHAPSNPTAATEPSALGSAFDLGSGPTVLLIVLAGTAVLLLGGSGVRVWRHRDRA
jgi:hypothetical protein